MYLLRTNTNCGSIVHVAAFTRVKQTGFSYCYGSILATRRIVVSPGASST